VDLVDVALTTAGGRGRNSAFRPPLSRMPSTVIRERFYDAGTSRLTITFVTGRMYVYEDVPPDVMADFDAARSKGQFFNAHIRDRYRCREVTPAHE
jgi:hypothetical protein